MRKWWIAPVLALLVAGGAAPARGDVPEVMHFQGILCDDDGLPVGDTVAMEFRLYADTLDAPLWSEMFESVPVVNGFYEVFLAVAEIPFDRPYFLEVVVEGAPLAPKKPLATVPYSFRSGRTKVLAGEGLSGESDSGAVTLSLGDEGVASKHLAPAAVSSEHLADSSVTASKLAAGAAVRSFCGITDHVDLVAGEQIAIDKDGSAVRISAVVSGEASDDDWEVDGEHMSSLVPGNVGIGVITPGEKLDVDGSVRAAGQIIAGAAPGTPPLAVSSTALVAGLNADRLDGRQATSFADSSHDHDASEIVSGVLAVDRLPVGSDADEVAAGDHGHDASEIVSGVLSIDRLPVGNDADEVAPGDHTHSGEELDDGDWTVAGEDLHTQTPGKVGIGTESPLYKLDVNGEGAFDGAIHARDATGVGLVESGGAPGVWVGTEGRVGVGTEAPEHNLHLLGAGQRKMVIETSDMDGFGSIELTTPGGILDYLELTKHGPAYGGTTAGIPLAGLSRVCAGPTAGALMLQVQTANPIYFVTENSEKMRLTPAGRLGIGTESPSVALEVSGEMRVSADSGSTVLEAYSSDFSLGQMVNLETAGNVAMAQDILQIRAGAGTSNSCQFIECERGGDPVFRVYGNGDVTADGAISGGGADFAEMVGVGGEVGSAEPGDVMVIDRESPDRVVPCFEAYSTGVAGIYSERPGFIASDRDWDAGSGGGEERGAQTMAEMAADLDQIPLAVVGIVPCKVSAANGPIRPGDLLVTSSIPGHAMRAEHPAVGTVVGKAFGALSAGTGTIRVLVTLQ